MCELENLYRALYYHKLHSGGDLPGERGGSRRAWLGLDRCLDAPPFVTQAPGWYSRQIRVRSGKTLVSTLRLVEVHIILVEAQTFHERPQAIACLSELSNFSDSKRILSVLLQQLGKRDVAESLSSSETPIGTPSSSTIPVSSRGREDRDDNGTFEEGDFNEFEESELLPPSDPFDFSDFQSEESKDWKGDPLSFALANDLQSGS